MGPICSKPKEDQTPISTSQTIQLKVARSSGLPDSETIIA